MKSIVRAASAGRAESGDAQVSVAPCEGIELSVASTLYSRFGQAVEAAARDVLGERGVENARVSIDDHGALDWVLRARLETALERGGVEPT